MYDETNKKMNRTLRALSLALSRVPDSILHTQLHSNALLHLCVSEKGEQKREQGPYFVGIDVNTKSTGLVLCDFNGFIKHWEFVELSTNDSLMERAGKVGKSLRAVKENVEASQKERTNWVVGVEDYLRVFFRASTSASLFSLAEMNAMVKYDCFHIFGSPPLLFHPRISRSLFGLNDKTVDIKDQVVEFVKQSILLHVDPPAWKLNKKKAFAKGNVDIADACLIAWLARHQYLISLASNNESLREKVFADVGIMDDLNRLAAQTPNIKKELWDARLQKLTPWGPFPSTQPNLKQNLSDIV